MSVCSLNIVYLPEVALEKIFSFLTFDQVAKNRAVCRTFNEVGGKLLSRGFYQLEKRHAAIYKRVKSLLPRRESERRSHPLARHCDVLQAIETRISMLNMTYVKYVESNMMCFIPGKVLDEMKNVLTMVELDRSPPRAHQLLQELRDLSSMAMEHFEEHILPIVRERYERRLTPSIIISTKSFATQNAFSNELHKVKTQSKANRFNIGCLTQTNHKITQKLRRQTQRLRVQSQRLKEQERKLAEQSLKIQEQETALAEIKRHINECNQRYSNLSSEMTRAREDIMTVVVPRLPPSPSSPSSSSSSSLSSSSSIATPSSSIFRNNIKPRSAHILPKSYLNLQLDPERKRKSNLLPEIPLKRSKAPEATETSPRKRDDLRLKVAGRAADFMDDKAAGKPENERGGLVFAGGSLMSSSLQQLLKNPLAGIGSRKRKVTEDLDMN